MAVGDELLPEPMLNYCQWGTHFNEIQTKIQLFIISILQYNLQLSFQTSAC